LKRNPSVFDRVNSRVGKTQLRLFQRGPRLGNFSVGRLGLRARDGNLFGRGVGLIKPSTRFPDQ
jgi:hypothetical protein